MRLWSIHPKYLDRQGLLAVWREGLLAQKVLQGRTRGYRNHPQLERFRRQNDPISAISAYLKEVHKEAQHRGFHFNSDKISPGKGHPKIGVASGQLDYEMAHLKRKLWVRDREAFQRLRNSKIAPHPLFKIITGPVEDWERVKQTISQ